MNAIRLAKASTWLDLPLSRVNRHGLIAGATGTGKTVSLRVMAEALSRFGVPCFMADVKGDLAGLSQPGTADTRLTERANKLGVDDFAPASVPTIFWDLAGEQGHPIRAAISEMGPLLLGRLLELTDVQSGVLDLAFKFADDHGLALIDLKDLRALLVHIAENSKALSIEYGNVATASVGAVQRALLTLEAQGGDRFFGEPALDFADLMRRDGQGRGVVSILAADKLMMRPRLYATFLLWLLAELFERLPEEGDLDQPKLVFFFDEAHLLFDDAPPALVDKVEQMVRLIRSKGVGVFFVTQNPLDLPEPVLGQLGNRVQHALRAFTPKDQRAVKVAADTFRPNPRLDTARAITELAVGEALVSLLDESGTPAMVERAMIVPPCSRLGAITPAERSAVMRVSPCAGKYDQVEDRISAYEQLGGPQRTAAAAAERQQFGWGTAQPAPGGQAPQGGWPTAGGPAPTQAPTPPPPSRGMLDSLGSIFGPGGRGGSRRESIGEAVAKSLARNMAGTIGRQVASQIFRGIFGTARR